MEDLVSVADDFDPAQYARLPRFDVVAGIALCRQLVSTLYALTPEDAQALRRSTERLQQEVTSLQQVWLEQQSAGVTPEPAPVDQMADTAWRLLHDRLQSYATLPPEQYPEAVRAAEILGALFPTGLSFLALDYQQQWQEAEARIGLARSQGLWATCIAWPGPRSGSRSSAAISCMAGPSGRPSPRPRVHPRRSRCRCAR